MSGHHPKVSKLPTPALVVGVATLVIGAGVAAQEAVTALRLRGSSSEIQLAQAANPAAGPGSTAPGAPAAASAAEARGPKRARRPATRRARQITAQPVQGKIRADTFAPDTLREVQPIFEPMTLGSPRRKRRPLVEKDPYAQVGFRVGNVDLFPAVQQNIGYDTNPNRDAGFKKGSIVHRTDGELRLQSDWSRHELTGLLRGAYSEYPDVKSADRPEAFGRVNLRLDATRDTKIDIEGRYFLDTQRPGSPELNTAVLERPLVQTGGASLGFTQRFNRLILGLRGSVDRTIFEDALLPDGSILDQGDRNVTQYEARLRAGYELKPGLVPFVEAIADTRDFDRRVDDSGFRRTSDGLGARAGTTFEVSPKTRGEVSAGYMQRTYEDARLKDLRGPLVEAAVIWEATPLTTVRLRGSTQIADTSIADSPGALVSRATLEVQHDLRRNLSLIGALTFSEADYKQIDLREEGFAASIKLDYRFTRSVALRASFTHERLKSTDPGSDYTANVYLVGLRFQP